MPVYTFIQSPADFLKILRDNDGVIIIRFTATWCKPCKRIEPLVNAFFQMLPENPNIEFYNLDVDVNTEIYSFLRSKRRVNGIPAALCYYRGNSTYIEDDGIIGADVEKFRLFFANCLATAKSMC